MADTHKASFEEVDIAREKEAVGSVHGVDVNPAAAALAAATEADKPRMFSKGMLKLWLICSIGYLVSTMNGFDSSLMGSINAMTQYQSTFGLSGAGSSTGIIFIIYNLGQIAAFPFCGLFADGLGRRYCIIIGCALVIVGTAIQTPSHTQAMFMGGRFVLGFGAAIASAAGPAYIVELAHPSFRGFQAGMYRLVVDSTRFPFPPSETPAVSLCYANFCNNNFWWVGNILAGWTTYGSDLHLHNSWAWRTPTLVQCLMPAIAMVAMFFFPESPRWLIAKDRREEAAKIFAKYHADGDIHAPIVKLQVGEIVEQMSLYRDENPWWDFRELYNTRAARYRLAMVIAMAFFGQWSGNNVVSYFMPQMFKQAGIENPSTQLLLTAINPIFSMMGAVYGATLLDKLGRRKMLLIGLTGGLFAYCLLTAFTAESEKSPNLGYGVIVAIYIFGIFFAWGWTPLQTLYSVECLENRTRAKGSGANFLFLNIAMVVNTYGIAVGIEAIGWKLYLVYIGWIVVEMVVIFFFFVETAGKTLEELSVIFNAKNPVKKSLEKTRVTVDESGRVMSIDGQHGGA